MNGKGIHEAWLAQSRSIPYLHEMIDAAIHDAEEATARRCVAEYEKLVPHNTYKASLAQAILAAAHPPQLPPFGCTCWEPDTDTKSGWHRYIISEAYWPSLSPDAKFCEVCGNKRVTA